MGARPRGEVLAAVRAYTSAVAGCPPDRVTDVSRFEDGNRHAVYRVSHLDDSGATRDVVVRVSHRGDDSECAQAEREARALEKTGGRAAPALLDFRCGSPWFEAPTMCMEYVPGRRIDLGSASPTDIERLGSLVASVHRCPPDDATDGTSAPSTVASYAERRLESILGTMSWAREPLPGAVQTGLRTAGVIVGQSREAVREAACFRTGEALCMLHGDIAPGNILWGPHPVLIDWEYTRPGDPADEIAYLFDQNGLSPHRREAFWRGYRGEGDDQSTLRHLEERVAWWEPLTLLGSALWWAERWVRRTEADPAGLVDPEVPRDPAYYLDGVVHRLDRLDDLLARS